MGLILDSSVLISAERTGRNANDALNLISNLLGGEEVALSVVTVMEIEHGVARADSPERAKNRRKFIQEILSSIPAYPIDVAVASRAGQLDGLNTAKGIHIALSDLLIGATALEHGFGVATANLRHFRLIPGLNVVEL